MRWPDSLMPLRDPQFAWYYVGRVVSTTGSMMAPIALTFAVLDLTNNSATSLGEVLAARSIPMVIFLLVGGVVADRFSRSMVLQLSHLLAAATQGAVAALLLTGEARLWMLIVLEAVNGTVAAFTFPAMQGVIPQVVPRSHLQQANAMVQFSRGGLAMIGPTIGALLVVSVGSGWAIAIDALTWALASPCMARVRVKATRRRADSLSMWGEISEGWSTFRSLTWVWVAVLAFCALNMIWAGAWNTLGPTLAKATIGIPAWGYVTSAEAVGLFVLTIVMMRWRSRYPLRTGMIAIGLSSLPLILLGAQSMAVPVIIAAFLSGCGIEVFSIGWATSLQEHIPVHLLSRMWSYDALGSFVAMPIGQLAFGPLAGVFPLRDILVASGVAYLLIVVATLMSSSLRNLEHAPVSTQVPSAAAEPAT